MILKLRFVLQPFSFIFLLAGQKKYHIIWETLDTEDATYVWHTYKTRSTLRFCLDTVEAALRSIKEIGRQRFLEQEQPEFTRIFHDYSNEKKGFILWKGVLEEVLV